MALNVLRTIVSGKRRRFKDESFSLDLSYIQPRVIAMSLPGESTEALYRNSVDDVVRFLYQRHGTHFRVFNLSERTYDYRRFPAGAIVECGFPDLNTCPLHLAISLARQMQAFLAQAPRNVVVVHCLAGKGRTGVVIGAYLLLTLAVRDELWNRDKLEASLAMHVPLPLQTDEDIAAELVAAEAAVAAGSASGTSSAEEVAVIEASVPPAFELAARASLTFKRLRGDGLNYKAQLRTLRYIAEGVRTTVVEALVAAGEGRRLLAEQSAAAAALAAPTRVAVEGTVVAEEAAVAVAAEAPSAVTEETAASPAAAAVDSDEDSAVVTRPPQVASEAAPAPLPRFYPRTHLALPALSRLTAPIAPTIVIWNVVLHGIPRRAGSPPESGCSPSVQLRSLPHQHLPDTSLYDSAWASPPGGLPSYTQDDDAIVINVNAVLGGDVLLRIMHHPGQDEAGGSGGVAAAPGAPAGGRATALVSSALAGLRATAQKLQAALSPRSAQRESESGGGAADAVASPTSHSEVEGGSDASSRSTPVAEAAEEASEGSEEDVDIDSDVRGEGETAGAEDAGAGAGAVEMGGGPLAPVTAVSGPLVPQRAGAGRPSEILRYAFSTAFMHLDQREGPNIHRIFKADVDQERRHKVRGGGTEWRLPESFYIDVTWERKGSDLRSP